MQPRVAGGQGQPGPGELGGGPGVAGLLAIGVIAARAVTGPPRPLADLAAELRARPGWAAAPGLLDDPPCRA